MSDLQIEVGVKGGNDIARVAKEIGKIEKNVELLYNTYKKGQISQSAFLKGLNQQAVAVKGLGFSYQGSVKVVNQYVNKLKEATAEQQRFSYTAQESGKKQRQFQLAVQQSGYQVGDFFTQVASGTNPMVAFTQQATQLAGFFAGPWGAAIGAALSIVGALGIAFMATRDSTKSFSSVLKEAREETKTLTDELELLKSGLDSLEELRLTTAISELETLLAGMKELTLEVNTTQLERQLKKAEDQLAALRGAREEISAIKSKETYEEITRELNHQLALLVLEADARSNIVAIEAEKSKYERESFKLELDRKGIIDDQYIQAMALYDAIVLQKNALKDITAEEERRLAVQALQNRQFYGTAAGQALSKYGGRGTKSSRAITGDIPEKGGRTAPAQESNLQRLIKQIALEEELIGKTEAQARVLKALGDERRDYDAATIAGLTTRIEKILKEQELLKEQEELAKRLAQEQQNLANNIQASMENSFMSIVDGTLSVKDAFKAMARDIIAQLYRVIVVQRIVGSFDTKTSTGTGIMGFLGGLVGSANGNVFSQGNVVPFANGGIVGGPTLFPMSGGKTGLMGEAGPEAIMPLKRGPNGKLGVEAQGAGSVVVNQSFNFSANGDESVKRIIAKEAPRIAQMTQQQIMDSRRRGGNMKATFG